MKILIFFCFAIACSVATNKVEDCSDEVCKSPECRCSSTNVPNELAVESVPQLVFLTFDDAVTGENYALYKEAFYGKVNPDGCPIQATYFVSHEYTDYSLLHDLHANGHEISLHSITHNSNMDYWIDLPVEELVKEFAGEKELLSNFAAIESSELNGLRLPLLQLSGDNSFKAMQEVGLNYDCSWPTQRFMQPGLWPYTLDYRSIQDCPISPCPESSFPGTWVVPMIMWTDDSNYTCSMVDACTHIPADVDGIYKFILKNFNKQYQGNKAPFGFYVHAAWFQAKPNAFEAYLQFIDYLQTLNDVYIVGISRGLEWVKNANTLENIKTSWPECQLTYQNKCQANTCKLMKGEEERYMTLCGNCPASYPWLDNPLGQ